MQLISLISCCVRRGTPFRKAADCHKSQWQLQLWHKKQSCRWLVRLDSVAAV